MMVVLNHGNWQTLQIRVSPVGATFRKYLVWALPQIQEKTKQNKTKPFLTEDHRNQLCSRENLQQRWRVMGAQPCNPKAWKLLKLFVSRLKAQRYFDTDF